MTADLAEVRAALAMVAQATPGPWSARIFTTHVVDSCQQTQWHEVGSQHGTICEAPPSVFEDETAIGASNIRAIVALRNAAPAISAAVEELTAARAEIASAREQLDRLRSALDEREGDMHMRIRAGYDKTVADTWRAAVAKRDAEIAALRDLAGEAIETASEAPDGGDQVADYRERLASLNRQVCRLVSGHAIESDHLCQHHGADVAALAQIARYQAAAVAVATEIGGPLGPVDDDPEERAAAFVRFAEGLAGRVRERVEAVEVDLVMALHRERRVSDESDERLRRMAELLIKDANNE